MNVSIQFQSLDRIVGKEGRSKLLHNQSDLYTILHRVKTAISQQYQVGDDRMDLHIEITKQRRDEAFRTKAESIHGETVDLADSDNWAYLGRAFVLWTPEVNGYGRTHITIAFFGNHPKPSLTDLSQIISSVLTA